MRLYHDRKNLLTCTAYGHAGKELNRKLIRDSYIEFYGDKSAAEKPESSGRCERRF